MKPIFDKKIVSESQGREQKEEKEVENKQLFYNSNVT